MVEIDYYSKYLKYKQKYLKQKNLQVGGEDIYLNIKLKINKNPEQLYQLQKLDLDQKISVVIRDWLEAQNIIPTGVFTVTNNNKQSLDIDKTFRVYKNNETLKNNSSIYVNYENPIPYD
jgi:hypothetical protein